LYLQVKDLLELADRVGRVRDRVANRAWVLKDLIVITTGRRLVAKEVDRLVLDAARLLRLGLEVTQAVRLVPAVGEHIKADLPTNGKRQAQVGELLLQDSDKLLADLGLIVVLVEGEALLVGGVPADGADVGHAVAELDKGAALDGDVEVGDVVQAKVDELLPVVLADGADEAVGGQLLAELVGGEAVLAEAVVEEGGDGDAGGAAELLLLLGEVGAADEADGALLAEGVEGGEGLGGDLLLRGELGQCREGTRRRGQGGVRDEAWSGDRRHRRGRWCP
jgi:hypothetical protein